VFNKINGHEMRKTQITEVKKIEKTTEITTKPVDLLADAETTSTITTTTDEHPSTSTPRRHSFDTSNSTHYLPTSPPPPTAL
jgi:hypothetical protein